jgi:hypothetical protein
VPEGFDGGFKRPRHRSPYDKDVEDGEIIDIGGKGPPVGDAPPGGGSGGGVLKEMAVGSGRVEAHNRLLPAVKERGGWGGKERGKGWREGAREGVVGRGSP